MTLFSKLAQLTQRHYGIIHWPGRCAVWVERGGWVVNDFKRFHKHTGLSLQEACRIVEEIVEV